MRAVIVESHGGPEQLRYVTDHPEPVAGPGQVVVRVAVIGVNFIDLAHRSGGFGVPAPFVPGVEGAGTIASIGPGVDGLTVGDRVAWAMPIPVDQAGGGYAELVALPADRVLPLPTTVDEPTAAAGLMHGLTAHYLTESVHSVAEGDVVLVHAAAGGLGQTLVQVARSRGATVLGTASTARKRQEAVAAGAHAVFDYADVVEEVRKYTDGLGATVVYDGVGAPTIMDSLDSLRARGTLALIGTAGGPVTAVDPMRLLTAGSITFVRPGLPDYVATGNELRDRARTVFTWLGEGTLTAHIGGRYPLSDAVRAHQDLAARRTHGKLLLTV